MTGSCDPVSRRLEVPLESFFLCVSILFQQTGTVPVPVPEKRFGRFRLNLTKLD